MREKVGASIFFRLAAPRGGVNADLGVSPVPMALAPG